MQTLAESEFLAQRDAPGFGGKESIGAAFDDELSIVEGDAVGGDLAAPMRIGFEEGNVNLLRITCCVLRCVICG